MNCEQATEHLSAFLDGELREAERRQVSEHLSGCPACQRRADQIRRVAFIGGHMPPVQAPGVLSQNVMRRIRLEQPALSPRRFFSFKLAWAAPVLACLFVAVAVKFYWAQHPVEKARASHTRVAQTRPSSPVPLEAQSPGDSSGVGKEDLNEVGLSKAEAPAPPRGTMSKDFLERESLESDEVSESHVQEEKGAEKTGQDQEILDRVQPEPKETRAKDALQSLGYVSPPVLQDTLQKGPEKDGVEVEGMAEQSNLVTDGRFRAAAPSAAPAPESAPESAMRQEVAEAERRLEVPVTGMENARERVKDYLREQGGQLLSERTRPEEGRIEMVLQMEESSMSGLVALFQKGLAETDQKAKKRSIQISSSTTESAGSRGSAPAKPVPSVTRVVLILLEEGQGQNLNAASENSAGTGR